MRLLKSLPIGQLLDILHTQLKESPQDISSTDRVAVLFQNLVSLEPLIAEQSASDPLVLHMLAVA